MRKLPSHRKKGKGSRKARVPRGVPDVRAVDGSSPRGPLSSTSNFTPWLPDNFIPWPHDYFGENSESADPFPVGEPATEVRTGGVNLPIPGLRTVSEANSHEHWRKRYARSYQQKNLVTLALRGTVAAMMAPLAPLVVTLTRIAPSNGLDSDNMVGSQKHVRDAIAKVLGIDDGDPRVEYRVEQRKGPWGIEIRIEVK